MKIVIYTWLLSIVCAIGQTNYFMAVGDSQYNRDKQFILINPTNIGCATAGLITNYFPGEVYFVLYCTTGNGINDSNGLPCFSCGGGGGCVVLEFTNGAFYYITEYSCKYIDIFGIGNFTYVSANSYTNTSGLGVGIAYFTSFDGVSRWNVYENDTPFTSPFVKFYTTNAPLLPANGSAYLCYSNNVPLTNAGSPITATFYIN